MRLRLLAAIAILVGLFVSSSPTPTQGSFIYTDDFSSYPTGQPPTGWDQFGTTAITPYISEVGGTGSLYKQLRFPYLGSGYTDKHLVYNNLSCADVTATVKVNFRTSIADNAGLIIGWSDANNRIDAKPNIYWGNLEFDQWVNGVWTTRTGTPRWSLSINTYTNYWLRVSTTQDPSGSTTATVYWSTDGVTFQSILTVPGLVTTSGKVGLTTSGVNLPEVLFDDFTVTGNCQALNAFTYPMDLSMRTGVKGYDIQNPDLTNKSGCYSGQGKKDWVYLSQTWHAGEDWFASPATPVMSVADGVVYYVSPGGYNYPGAVVIIDHTLPDSSHVFSMYGHLDPNKVRVSQGALVTKGQTIADGLLYQTYKVKGKVIDNTQLHWEIRLFADGSGINSRSSGYTTTCSGAPGPGYTYPGHPDNFVANGGAGPTYRWSNPSAFVTTH